MNPPPRPRCRILHCDRAAAGTVAASADRELSHAVADPLVLSMLGAAGCAPAGSDPGPGRSCARAKTGKRLLPGICDRLGSTRKPLRPLFLRSSAQVTRWPRTGNAPDTDSTNDGTGCSRGGITEQIAGIGQAHPASLVLSADPAAHYLRRRSAGGPTMALVAAGVGAPADHLRIGGSCAYWLCRRLILGHAPDTASPVAHAGDRLATHLLTSRRNYSANRGNIGVSRDSG